MTKLRLLALLPLIVSSALAGPVMAQQVVTNPGRCAQYYPDANCQNFGPGNPYTDGYQRPGAYREHNTRRQSVNKAQTPTLEQRLAWNRRLERQPLGPP